MGHRKACVQYLAHIRLTVTVRVLEKQDVRGSCGNEASLPRRDALHGEEAVGVHRMPVDHTVAVGVF